VLPLLPPPPAAAGAGAVTGAVEKSTAQKFDDLVAELKMIHQGLLKRIMAIGRNLCVFCLSLAFK
jgi:hypothetical protein